MFTYPGALQDFNQDWRKLKQRKDIWLDLRGVGSICSWSHLFNLNDIFYCVWNNNYTIWMESEIYVSCWSHSNWSGSYATGFRKLLVYNSVSPVSNEHFLRAIFWENQADLEKCGTWWSPIFLKLWYKFPNYKNRKTLNFYQNLTCRSRDIAISISERQLTKTKICEKSTFWAQFTSQSKKLPDICQWDHKIDMHINKNWWSKISCVVVAANRALLNILNIQPSHQVRNVRSAIFHCNMAVQVGFMAHLVALHM